MSLKVKHILVTGATGFVGKQLTEYLRRSNYSVIEHSSKQGDIANFNFNSYHIDHIVHLAARTYVPESWNNPYEYYRTNVLGTLNILEYCRNKQIGLTFLSTYIYGIPCYLPINENHPSNANTPYNHSKLIAEDLCKHYYQFFGVNITILRAFNVYGPEQDEKFIIPYILKQYFNLQTHTIEVMDLSPKRDFIYIDDLIDAIVLTLNLSGLNIFNVGSGISYSVEEIIQTINTIGPFKKPYKDKGILRKSEINEVIADINNIKEYLGWAPKINLASGLKKIINEAYHHGCL